MTGQEEALDSKERGPVETMDRAVARLLRVPPRPRVQGEATAPTGSRPFEAPLLVSAVRCVLRYLVLPFVLPLLGAATGATLGVVTGAALGVLVALDVIAIVAVVATLRRLWRFRHPRRWPYLPVALVLVMLVGVFFLNDVGVLVS